jgi:AcrR family transcriptional regulator
MSSARRPASPERPPLSRERVVLAAIELADAEGLAALSMRSLARRLEVEAMSLYNHVENKEDLLDGMVEAVVAKMEVPHPGARWRAEMRRRALSAYEVLRRHPWASLLIVSRLNVGPMMLRYHDATLGCLIEAGFPPDLADHAQNAIDSHVHGFTLHEQSLPLDPGDYAEAAGSFLPSLPSERYPYMRTLAETVIAGEYDGLNHVEFGLDLLLDGLDELVRRLRHRGG